MVKSNFSSTLKGVFWMIITGLLFVGVTAIVKYVGTALPAVQAAFLRYTLGVIIFLPLLPKIVFAELFPSPMRFSVPVNMRFSK